MPKRRVRRSLWPMPVQDIIQHPLCLNMPGAAFGAFMRLCLHYWLTNCSPLPESSGELQVISRAVAPIWNKHRETIMQAFRDVSPELNRYYQTRHNRIAGLRISRERSVAARRKGMLERHPQIAPASVTILPRTLPRAPKKAETNLPVAGRMKEKIPVAF